MKTFQTFGLVVLSVLLAGGALAQESVVGIATTTTPGLVKPDGSTITITADGTISSSSSGPDSGITAAQFTLGINSGTNTFRGTNINVTQIQTGGILLTNGLTNNTWTANTDLEADSHKKAVSLANAAGVKTNDGSGNVGYTLILPPVDLSASSNFLNGGKTFAGANITVTPAKDAKTGATNNTIAVSDPVNLGQGNFGTAWLTNSVSPTNTMGGTAIDFSMSESRSNIAGNVTFSSVANLTAGAYNRKVIHLVNASGSDRTLSLATGWGAGLNDTFVITNGTRMDLWCEVEPLVFTNVFQKQIPIH